jgi:hypothetical protein
MDKRAMFQGCEHCGFTAQVAEETPSVPCPECARPLNLVSAYAAAELRRERFEADRNRAAAAKSIPFSRVR